MFHKSLKECVQTIESNLGERTVIILSIGSRVSAGSTINNNDQMQPPFADEIAQKSLNVHVINIDPSYTESLDNLLQGPTLQRATVHYTNEPLGLDESSLPAGMTRQSGDVSEQQKVLTDILKSGTKLILIDNTSKKLSHFTIDFAREHQSELHHNLEIIHRYISIDGGVALHYNKNVFDNQPHDTQQKIANAMQVANGGNTYDSKTIPKSDRATNFSSSKQRQYWIEHRAEYQARIGDIATFYPVGIRSIDANKMFDEDLRFQLRTPNINVKIPAKRSQFFQPTPMDQFKQLHIAAKIALVALMVVTLPVSLIVLSIALLVNYFKNSQHEKTNSPKVAVQM